MIPVLLLLLIPQLLFANTLDSLLADNRVRAGVRAEDLFDPLDNPAKYDTLLKTGFPKCDQVDYRWLLANLPLADLALMTKDDLLENVHLASAAVAEAPWADQLTPEHYFHYILPHRVSQEPFVRWRAQFKDEITPRLAGLSIKEAILEVNHWCHEKATYRPTDGRDQDPLTTIRSGFGRCEEEMILTICALRSVGIPARQCYTPYWAHSDDNHAWVEAWGGDGWYYLGACEPAQELNQAWFSGPAQRAMLVVSTAYGDVESPQSPPAITTPTQSPHAIATPTQSPPAIAGGVGGVSSDPVLRRYGRSTLINSTAVYGPTKELTVRVLDKKGALVPNCRVIFSLWNYGTLMPAMGVSTDSTGTAKLVCGIGDWFVSASSPPLAGSKSASSPPLAGGAGGGVTSDPLEDDILFWVTGLPKKVSAKITSWFKDEPKTLMAFAHVKGSQTEVTLKLDSETPVDWLTELEYTPPPSSPASGGGVKAPEVISAEGIARGITSSTMQSPPSIEGGVGGVALSKALADSLFRARLAWEDSVREANVWSIWAIEQKGNITGTPSDTIFWFRGERIDKILRPSRGNWGEIFRFIYNEYPTTEYHERQSIENRWGFRGARGLDFYSHDILLTTLSEKDLRDVDMETLEDHSIFHATTGSLDSINSPFSLGKLDKNDSIGYPRYKNNVIAPRIDHEPSLPWRKDLIDFLKTDSVLIESNDALLDFLRDSITVESTPDRLGPPLTPAQCLELRRGTETDVERLYIGFCRVRGIPARRNPVTGQVERWEMEDGKWKMEPGWLAVDVLQSPTPAKAGAKAQRPDKKGSLTLTVDSLSEISNLKSAIYLKDWAVAKWEGNMADAMDLGWHEPFEKVSWPQELPVGWYLVSSGKRREDGSAAVTLQWVEVKKDTIRELKFRD